MVNLSWILAAAVAAQGTVATLDELQQISNLLKRQAPGSAAYRCHEACGQAILAARASKDVCSDDSFLTNYDTCLKCSGPDDIDIWKIYGRTLSGFGESCGLSTTPVSGESADAGSTTSATPTSTISGGPTTSSPVVSTTASPTASTTTAGEASTTSIVSTTPTNGTAIPTGVVPVNMADALPKGSYGSYAAAMLVVLYAIAH